MGARLVNTTIAQSVVTLWYLLIAALVLIACIFYCHCMCHVTHETIHSDDDDDAMEMQYI